jgi:predicted AAA+ superfamily ATPase
VDEIQRRENAGRFLKGIYDTLPKVKFVVSGSGSLELREQIVESLAGRKRMFEISPVSYFEFVDYQTSYGYSERLADYLSLNTDHAESMLLDYLRYGGYPRVITTSAANQKHSVLQEILSSYLHRDIETIIAISRKSDYSQLLRLLSAQLGQLISYSHLSQGVTIGSQTVKEYIWYMEQTYMVRLSAAFFRNAAKEITKAPVLYFNDVGVANLLANNGAPIEPLFNYGFLFQNWVFNELRILFREQFANLKHWRSKDKAEVDIVLEIGNRVVPIEVKTSAIPNGKVSRSFRSFLRRYKPDVAFLIHTGSGFSFEVEGVKVYALPFHQLSGLPERIP